MNAFILWVEAEIFLEGRDKHNVSLDRSAGQGGKRGIAGMKACMKKGETGKK